MRIFDEVVIKGGQVVLQDRVEHLDIKIVDGVIHSMEPHIEHHNGNVIDADGLFVAPGMIDIHVHLNEPGLAEWEGIPSGSSALAAGGCTTYFDMPLNGLPPTISIAALEEKRRLATGRSAVDYAFWGGLVPGNLEQLAPLSEAGVIGYKAFMSAAGGKQPGAFRESDDATLYEGMKRIAELGRILALHAESEPLIAALTRAQLSGGRTSAADYAASRPVYAEVEAVRRALFYAELTGCALHFVHISSPEAVMEIVKAKRSGMDVTLETCPHYLVLTSEAMHEIGALAKCAPPLRTVELVEEMWQAIARGEVDIISSDHSPCPPELKVSENWFEIWGGISGAQSSVELFLGEGSAVRKLPLPLLCRMLAANPAQRFGMASRKGEIAPGKDADVVLIDFASPYELRKEHLLDRHKQNPYAGQMMHCRIRQTLVRGQMVYDWEKGILNGQSGRFILPGC
ncbi:allantoinase AllB [Paenibacillaceae bacterium]|nr:allantoinase AllB [Paenibacillaceae bacterium]